MSPDALPDLSAVESALDLGAGLVRGAAARLAASTDGGRRLDDEQVFAYDLAHAAAGLETARAALEYGRLGADEACIAVVFAADVLSDLVARTAGREASWGTEPGWHGRLGDFISAGRSPALMAQVAERPGNHHLDPEFEMVREAFRRFADEQIAPLAEHIHRENTDIPEGIIKSLAEMGGFGLSVPEAFGGAASGTERDYLGMVVATEELSRASLGAGGSLVTRPEILTRALVKGGTEDQKRDLLPLIASGELMVAIAVTEPDYGSDVANISTTATPAEGGGWVVNGVKTWCTFAARADVLMLLARTDPDRAQGHRGLSVFVVPKPRGDAAGFVFLQGGAEGGPAGAEAAGAEAAAEGRPTSLPQGRLEGRPIDTIGYRGMHSYELAFENWWVPDDALVGGHSGKAVVSISRCRASRTGGFRPRRGRSVSCRLHTKPGSSTPGTAPSSAGRSSSISSPASSSAGWRR